jgi:N-acetylneuraminic acid mutarotase
MNPVKPLLSTCVRSQLYIGLLVLVLGVLTVLSAVPTLAAGSGTWTLTGSMHVAREDSTATLLQSGQVLVVGGYNTTSTINILASAELYNPATGKWTLTKSMHTARTGHAAALLESGQVLVAAGESSSSFLTSAELYNPSTGAWTSTGSLHTPRVEHTATLLPNGQVLVAGGLDSNYNYLASAELYTP